MRMAKNDNLLIDIKYVLSTTTLSSPMSVGGKLVWKMSVGHTYFVAKVEFMWIQDPKSFPSLQEDFWPSQRVLVIRQKQHKIKEWPAFISRKKLLLWSMLFFMRIALALEFVCGPHY